MSLAVNAVVRVAIYIRVSTEEQAKEGFSIAAQRERLSQFAAGLGWTIFDFYVDEGVSAKNTDRPELKRMLKDIKDFRKHDREGEIVVLVFRLDRLTRSILDLFQLLQVFDELKIGFKSATEIFDTTTAIGRLFITIIGALAQWERENLAERVQVGMEQMVLEGKFHGGTTPYGYDNGGDSKLVVNEEEAVVVKKIFEKYLDGDGDDKITRWLNKTGKRTKKGVGGWHNSTVRNILTNPVYLGSLRWNVTTNGKYFEVENSAPALITQEDFERAQQLRASRQGQHPRSVNSDYIFTGHIICARCGSPLSGSSTTYNGKKFKYYKCRGLLNGLCDLPSLNEEVMENCFLDYIGGLDLGSVAREVAASKEEVEEGKVNEELKKMRNELEKVKARKRKWQELYMEDLISKDDLRSNTQGELEKEQELMVQISQIESAVALPKNSPEQIAEAIQQFGLMWDVLSPSEKKIAVGMIIDKMTVDTLKVEGKKMKRRVLIRDVSFL